MSFLREVTAFMDDAVQVVDTFAKLAEFEEEEEAAGRPVQEWQVAEEHKDVDGMSIGQLVDVIVEETERFIDSPELADLLDRYAAKHGLGVYAEGGEAEETVKPQAGEAESVSEVSYSVTTSGTAVVASEP